GPDKAHVPSKHVQYLGQFVNSKLADYGADRCHTRIIALRPHGFTRHFCVSSHAPEFKEFEGGPHVAHALLTIENRCAPTVLEFDRKRRNQHRGERYDQNDRARNQVERSGGKETNGTPLE